MKATNDPYQPKHHLKLTAEEREHVDLERLARLLLQLAREKQQNEVEGSQEAA